MRLDINLATRPYEDARQFWLRWGTGLGVLGIVTLALLALTASGWYDARIDRRKINDLKAQIAERDRERSNAEAVLAQPQNRVIRDKSQYLNFLIARKAFSWTKAFEDLEKVMPARLHLLSIKPELNDDNQLAIKMVVGGDSYEHANDLLRRMETSTRFKQPTITQQAQESGQQNGDTMKAEITALYAPTADEVPLKVPAKGNAH
jgi:Tfp pilus assembly protein PilN